MAAKDSSCLSVSCTPPPLRVLVNGASATVGGGGSYLLNQMLAMSRRSDVRVTVYASATLARTLIANCPTITVRQAPTLPLALRLLWEQTALPWRARGFDVLYLPGNFCILAASRPQVVVFQNPHLFGATARSLRQKLFSLPWRIRLVGETMAAHISVRRADRAIAISNALAETIHEDLGLQPHLRVIQSAPPEGWATRSARDGGFALAVANDYPHKDWDGLVDAFLRFTDLPPLTLVGQPRSARRLSCLTARVKPAAGRVRLLGPIAERNRLRELYEGAACYVAHSYLEAFPLTPYEALAYALPIVAADIPSHREVCGKAAIYYDPASIDELAEAVRQAIRNPRPSATAPLMERSWDDNVAELITELAGAARRRHHPPGE